MVCRLSLLSCSAYFSIRVGSYGRASPVVYIFMCASIAFESNANIANVLCWVWCCECWSYIQYVFSGLLLLLCLFICYIFASFWLLATNVIIVPHIPMNTIQYKIVCIQNIIYLFIFLRADAIARCSYRCLSPLRCFWLFARFGFFPSPFLCVNSPASCTWSIFCFHRKCIIRVHTYNAYISLEICRVSIL